MDSPWRLKLLYDGKCPFCSREVNLLRRRNAQGQLAFEDITDAQFNASNYGLTERDVIGAMHAIRLDGTVVKGIDVFAEVYDIVGWRWLAAPLKWRLTRPFAQFFYNAFAKIRPWFSSHRPCNETCRLPEHR